MQRQWAMGLSPSPCALFHFVCPKGDVTMGKYTRADIIRLIQEEDVQFIRMQFTDIFVRGTI